MSTKSLTREAILEVKDLPLTEVPVPEWGGVVYVRSLSARDRDIYEASIILAEGDAKFMNIRARFLALVMVDENGDQIFSAEDVEALGLKSAAAVDGIWKVAQKLNKINKEDIEDLTKN